MPNRVGHVCRTSEGLPHVNTVIFESQTAIICNRMFSRWTTGPLSNAEYQIDIGRRVLTGTTTEDGMLYHEQVPLGYFPIDIGGHHSFVASFYGGRESTPSVMWLDGGDTREIHEPHRA